MLPKIYPYFDADTNLGIRAGDDWLQTLIFDDGATPPVLYNFTGHAAILQVRDKRNALVLEAKTADGTIVLGGAAGTCEFAVAAAVTAALTPGMYTYGLRITDTDTKLVTWLTGAFEVAKAIVVTT